MLVDLFAAFLDDPLQLVGFFHREATKGSVKGCLPLLWADGFQLADEIGRCFQLFRRQRFQILDNGFETAHDFKLHRHACRRQSGLRNWTEARAGESPRGVPMRYALGIL